MTLKEKFLKVPMVENGLSVSEKCEVIADEFAIEVLKWIANNNFRNYSNGWSKFDTRVLDEQQLLQMFKKEKGL